MSLLYSRLNINKGEMMTKIRVRTKDELTKEFGSYNGEPMVPAPDESLQGKVVVAKRICPHTGNAYVDGQKKPLDNCVYIVEKIQ